MSSRQPGQIATALRAVVGCAMLLVSVERAVAWGPHPSITRAAIDALGTDDALIRQLGASASALTNYAWMGDFRRLPFEDGEEAFYADDYLIFPGVSTHFDHILPEVKQTYRPYFTRALQALRTENPANAARWIGSLLHFAEDTGSPPHAAQIRGDVHTIMENWVDAELIAIPEYRPKSFGPSDEEALLGFLKRMDELIEFSGARGRRLQVPVTVGDRKAVKPIVLECALETSRVMADLLHTLGQLSQKGGKDTGTLRGVISAGVPTGPLARFPAKIVLEGTAFSTLADNDGHFTFRNLPPARYQMAVFRPSAELVRTSVELEAGGIKESAISLPSEQPNLIRNGDFK